MAVNESVLTREDILQAAEDVLRRFGPAKATVVDVARALGVSHGSVYRHFPSKVALRDAVTALWMARITDPLGAIVHKAAPASARLRLWLETLVAQKQAKARAEPELFATYLALALEATEMVRAHVAHLEADIAAIIADGVTHGEFAVADVPAAARAVLDATARFHNPVHASTWTSAQIDAELNAVVTLVLAGLRAR
jgi:AcrR family transcriptional regulator